MQFGKKFVSIVGIHVSERVEVESLRMDFAGEELERFDLRRGQSKFAESGGGGASDGVVVERIEGAAHPIPDRVRAGCRKLLTDDDAGEASESGFAASQRRHAGYGKDGAEARVFLYQPRNRALEIALGVEMTRRQVVLLLNRVDEHDCKAVVAFDPYGLDRCAASA